MKEELLIFLLGVVASLVGFALLNFVVKPIITYKKKVLWIASELRFYAHIITSPGASKELADEASKAIRKCSCSLEANYLAVPLKDLLVLMNIVPTDKKVSEASGALMFISNSLHREGKTFENHNSLKTVYLNLNIKELKNRHNIKNEPNFKMG